MYTDVVACIYTLMHDFIYVYIYTYICAFLSFGTKDKLSILDFILYATKNQKSVLGW